MGVGLKFVILCICIRYSIIETKEAAHIGYNVFLFPHEYPGDGLGATHLGLHLSTHAEKRNPLYPIRATYFVSIIMYLTCTIIVLLKKTNGMTFNSTTPLKLIY